MNYSRAIYSLRKSSAFTAMSEKYEDIIWQDENTKIPTKQECEDELKRLEEEDKKTQYQRDRAPNYPAIQEQLDLLYHDMTAGKGDKTGEWYKAVNKVKTDNPKPE